MDLPPAGAMHGRSTRIAEEAVAEAVRTLCRGGTWEGVARELAWRAVTAGGRELRALEGMCEIAEAKLAAHIDQAVWASERSALDGWHEYLESHPADEQGALAAARLDAAEEAVRLTAVAYTAVLDDLVGGTRAAAPPRRQRVFGRKRRAAPPEQLAA